MSQELCPIAEAQQDEMAQLNLCLVRGLCLRAQQNPQAALQEFRAGAAICERPVFSRHADEEAIHVATAIMTNLALTEFDLRLTTASNQHAQRSIAWAKRSTDHRLHAINLTHAGGVLANNCEADEGTISILEEAHRDADSLGLHNYAVLAASYLMTARAERARMEREGTLQQNTPTEALPPTSSSISSSSSSTTTSHTDSIPATINRKTAAEQGRQQQVIGLSGILLCLLAALFFAYILWQRRQKRRHNTMIEQLQAASLHRYIEGKEEERGRLAREMHDGVSNQLLAVQMKLQSEGLTPQTLQMLDESREQVRRLSHGLLPPSFLHTTLDEALSHYVDKLNGANGCELTYRSATASPYALPSLSADKALGVYRIVQEAISNILKHAQATTVAVVQEQTPESVTVTIADNGLQPFCQHEGNGIGLSTMQERADAIGAKIKVSTHKDAHLFTLEVPTE